MLPFYTYLVGGCVRDILLGVEPKDKDYLVVGATPQDLLSRGFTQVGADFPVFLHPETKEEYALARRERKIGPGYTGFETRFDVNVTAIEDLERRDFTINAIAIDLKTGEILDPFGGIEDLEKRILRHTSDAFSEDPLRVLRLARFAARYGFTICDETFALATSIVNLLLQLTPERIWTEFSKALLDRNPSAFFEISRNLGILRVILPELDRLYGIPQNTKYHPEGDAWVHTLLVLDRACELSTSLDVRLAALFHDLGKGETPKELLPAHHGHEERGEVLVRQIGERLRLPKGITEFAARTALHHMKPQRWGELRAGTVLGLLEAFNAFQCHSTLQDFLLVCCADARGKLGRELDPFRQGAFFNDALKLASKITGQSLIEAGRVPGPSFKGMLQQGRILAIKHLNIAMYELGLDTGTNS